MGTQEVKLQPLSADRLPTLAAIYQLYRHDLSEYSGQDVDTDGRFAHVDLEPYVTDDRYAAYLITSDGATAGLILVNLESHTHDGETVRNLDDLFVLRKFRRHGIGTAAVHKLLQMHPGFWQANKKTYNLPAMAFWSRMVPRLRDGKVYEQIVEGNIHIHIFRAPPND